MASHVVRNGPWAPGVTVSAYPAQQQVGDGPPSGSAAASAVVASDQTVTFAGLVDEARYVAYANGQGVLFRTDPVLSSSLVGAPAGVLTRLEEVEQLLTSAVSGVPLNLVANYSAVADGAFLSDVSMTNGSPVLDSAATSFSVLDHGKLVMVRGAGAAAGPLVATILSTSGGNAVLSVNAGTTVSGEWCHYGTDNAAAIALALAATGVLANTGSVTAGNALLEIPRGMYLTSGGNLDMAAQSKIKWRGHGAKVTTFVYTGTGTMFVGTGTAGSTKPHISITDCSFVGNTAADRCMDFTYLAPYLTIERNFFYGWPSGALRQAGCYEGTVRDNDAASCATRTGCWAFDFDRVNDSTSVDNNHAASCGMDGNSGGFRYADGFQGPAGKSKTVGCTVGVLIEQTSTAGTGTKALLYDPILSGMTVEGGPTQVYALLVRNAHATLPIRNPRLTDIVLNGGTGTLLRVQDSGGGGIVGLKADITVRDSGGGAVTTKLAEIDANVTESIIVRGFDTSGASGALWVDSGSGVHYIDRDGVAFQSATSAKMPFSAKVKGDANPRFTIGADGLLKWYDGTSAVADAGIKRNAANVLETIDSVLKVNRDGNSSLDHLTLSNQDAGASARVRLLFSRAGATKALLSLDNTDKITLQGLSTNEVAITSSGAVSLQNGGTKRVESNATGIGFFATAPVAKPTLAAAATDAATTQTLANDIRAKLIAYGLAA